MDTLHIIGIIILFVAGILLKTYLAQRRTNAVEAIALQLNLDFVGHGHQQIPSVVQSFNLFSRGRSRRVRNVLKGQNNGMAVFVFDYFYTTGSGKRKRTRCYTVAMLQVNRLTVPAFSLVPKTLFHTIGGWFGYQDINFEGYPLFSKRYLLRGSDEISIRQLFNHHVFSFYESKHSTCTEGLGNTLIYYRTGGNLHPQEWAGLLAQAQDVARLLDREFTWKTEWDHDIYRPAG
ncbi:MAG: hypothetical protein AAGD25_16465 [Cyanobacteria bacterium P01_F01_bin.150]